MSEDDIGGLANRLAMLVSDDGEADNAGRAVGALARRMGLTGGQLKAIFMAGAEYAGGQTARLADQDARIRTLEAELAAAQADARRAEQAARAATRERDAMRLQTERLNAALDRRNAQRQSRLLAGAVACVVLAGAGWLIYAGPQVDLGDAAPAAGPTRFVSALVRDQPVALHREPDAASPTIATVAEGTHLKVKRTFWHNLMQWVEVEINGESGYVLSSEVSLS